MRYLAANRRARWGSRAATAATVTSGIWRAGLISAPGVMGAAPGVPIRNRSTVTLSLARAAGGYLMQGDAGRDAGVERLGLRRDRDPHQHVAALRNQPGQPAPLRADHQHEWTVGHAQVAEGGVALRVETGHEQAGLLVGGERADQVGGPRAGRPGRWPARRRPASRPPGAARPGVPR